MLPTFIHIGPGQSATTMLYNAFVEHPDICMSTIKETNYFRDGAYHRGIEWYGGFFGHCENAMATGEVSNAYFYSPEVPARIAKELPNAKLVTVLRNPFDRLRTLYAYGQRSGAVEPGADWEEVLAQHPEFIEQNCYNMYLKRYLDHFGIENLKIAFFDDLKQDPQGFVQALYSFLGVDDTFVPATISSRVNPSVTARYRWLNPLAYRTARFFRRSNMHSLLSWAKQSPFVRGILFRALGEQVPQISASSQVGDLLVQRFTPYTKELEELTGRRLDGWYVPDTQAREQDYEHT